MLLSQSAFCTPGKTTKVHIDLFIFECSVGTHKITESLSWQAWPEIHKEKVWGYSPTNVECQIEGVLNQGRIRQCVSLSWIQNRSLIYFSSLLYKQKESMPTLGKNEVCPS